MNRREALQLLTTGMALPLVPRNLLGALREARLFLEAEPAARTLNAHQQATVRTMAELILPKTDTPGATDVGVTEFIDLMLTEWYDEPERQIFLRGISDADARAQSLFGKDLVDCMPAQQADILTALGETIQKARDHSPRGRASTPRSDDHFYAMLRRLTLIAYYTSEAGATAELKFEIIPDHYDGCLPVQVTKPESQ